MYQMENAYWWYQHCHAVMQDLLISLGANRDSKILDVGCGTGRTLELIGQNITPHAYGFDLSLDAAPFWRNRHIDRVCNASINNIAYASNLFDFVVSIDVLECEGVDERQAIGELLRVTKPGGDICIVFPAYDWLMSAEHHQAVHAIRRYTTERVLRLFSEFPGQPKKLSYFYMPTLPIMAVYRWLIKWSPGKPLEAPRSELRPLPGLLNGGLRWWAGLERPLLQHFNLPFGSSVLLVYRKQA